MVGTVEPMLLLLACTPEPVDIVMRESGTPDSEVTADSGGTTEDWLGGAGLGTRRTLVAVNYPTTRQRIYTLDHEAEILGYFQVPGSMYNVDGGDSHAQLMDFELLEGGNVMLSMWPKGLFEVNPDGEVVWEMNDVHASHDVDRLEDGNYLIARTWAAEGDKQIVERTREGEHVWSWRGSDRYGEHEEFGDISDESGAWMHINAVERLDEGITRACIRNFNLVIDINRDGLVVNEIQLASTRAEYVDVEGRVAGEKPHGMETTDEGTVLVGTRAPHRVVEVDENGGMVWQFQADGLRSVRDVDRLPNGNTLFTERTEVLEVNPEGEVVWRWEVPSFPWQEDTMEEVAPIMSVLRIDAEGNSSNR